MSEPVEISGKCLCGAVKFTARPEKHSVGVCHCDMCRHWTGGAFFALDCGDSVTFDGEENIAVYRSSEWAERGFCKTCGSNLFYKLVEPKKYIMSAGAIDGVEDFTLDLEVFIDEKPDYYGFANETKKMTGAEVFSKYSGDGGSE